jgi:dTMP kinase
MSNQPLFIVFEGIDGSGKSTQARLLYESLLKMNVRCSLMAEPSQGEWGLKIRRMLSGEETPPAGEQLRLFLLDREDDVRLNIGPALDAGVSVIMDRYYFSNAAYQGAMGLPPEFIIAENRKRNFPEPRRVYLIDIDPDTALERIALRNNSSRDIFEKSDFLHRVREILLSLADERFVILDGNSTPEDISSRILKDINALIN